MTRYDYATNGHAMSDRAMSDHVMSGRAHGHRDYGRDYNWYVHECDDHAHGHVNDSAYLHTQQRAPQHTDKQE